MRASNPLEEKVIALLEPAAADVGYALVRVRLSGLRRKRLQIMAERLSDGTMNIDDCSKLSRAISPVLDAEDPIQGFYDLEVSSPGIDRPLVRLQDFERFVGHEAKIELSAGVDGRRRYRGNIAGVNGDQVTMTVDGADVTFPFAWVSEGRLVLTDKLIEEDLRRAKSAEAADALALNKGEEEKS